MPISDYNTKPVRGDCAIILKLHGFTGNYMGSNEVGWGQVFNCTVVIT